MSETKKRISITGGDDLGLTLYKIAFLLNGVLREVPEDEYPRMRSLFVETQAVLLGLAYMQTFGAKMPTDVSVTISSLADHYGDVSEVVYEA